LPQIPSGAQRGAPQNHGRTNESKKDGCDAEEADIKRTDPKVE
jgi:hypothetical protein